MKNPDNTRPRAVAGFSLIEALIAVLVLATGLLALTALQGALIRSSADAKARSLIVAYAQSEMERFRLGGVPAVVAEVGRSSADDAQLGQLAQDAGIGAITQNVTVSQWNADDVGVFGPAPEPMEAPETPYFRDVTIALAWTDATGDGRSLSMTTSMSPLALTQSKVLVERNPPSDSGLRPVVRREFSLTEGMIPLAMGDGQDTAATNPKPLLVGRNDDTLVSDTRFEVLTYNLGDNNGADGYARFNKRIETAVIGCKCQVGTDGFATSGNDVAVDNFIKASSYRPAYWDGDRYREPVRVGAPATTSPTDEPQSELCDVCCRDHKDAGYATGPRFQPWPDQNADHAGSPHQHFLPDSAGVLQVATSGEYLESCRVIRVSGMWRVTSDPRLEDMAMLPTNVYPPQLPQVLGTVVDSSVATSPLASQAGKTSYTNFMYDFVDSRFNATNGNTDLSDTVRDAKHETAGLNNPIYVPLNPSTATPVYNDRRWLHARGVLVDFLEPEALKKVRDAYSDCEATTAEGRAQCVLPYSPFAAINVTEIADWKGRNSAVRTTTPQPSNFPGTAINYGLATMRRYSSAVALYPAVSPEDAASQLFDEQTTALLRRIRTGTWLTVSSTNGVIFGDATNPTRGVATVVGNTRFNVTWSGLSTADDRDKGNDPLLYVIPDQADLATEIACDANTAVSTSNPYVCSSESSSDVMLAMGRFNRMIPQNGKALLSVCGVSQRVDAQAMCQAYDLSSVRVGNTNYTPANVAYALVEGAAGRTTEKRTLVLPNVADIPANDSNVTLNLLALPQTQSTAVCNGTSFVAWTCD